MEEQWNIYKALLVDDDEMILEIYSRIIGKHFNEIFKAENGKQGFELFLEHRPDIVITDINMPVMNGIEMSKQILKEKNDQKLIAITAYMNDENYMTPLKNLGITVLGKPVKKTELFLHIDKLLK